MLTSRWLCAGSSPGYITWGSVIGWLRYCSPLRRCYWLNVNFPDGYCVLLRQQLSSHRRKFYWSSVCVCFGSESKCKSKDGHRMVAVSQCVDCRDLLYLRTWVHRVQGKLHGRRPRGGLQSFYDLCPEKLYCVMYMGCMSVCHWFWSSCRHRACLGPRELR